MISEATRYQLQDLVWKRFSEYVCYSGDSRKGWHDWNLFIKTNHMESLPESMPAMPGKTFVADPSEGHHRLWMDLEFAEKALFLGFLP